MMAAPPSLSQDSLVRHKRQDTGKRRRGPIVAGDQNSIKRRTCSCLGPLFPTPLLHHHDPKVACLGPSGMGSLSLSLLPMLHGFWVDPSNACLFHFYGGRWLDGLQFVCAARFTDRILPPSKGQVHYISS